MKIILWIEIINFKFLFLKFENDECIIKLVDFGISRYYNNPNIDKFLEHSFIDNLYENKL